MMKFNFDENDLKYEHAIKQDSLDLSFFESEEEVDSLLLRSNLAFAESVLRKCPPLEENRIPVSEQAHELLSVLQGIGIESNLFVSEKSISVPFSRQHRYIMELGDLTYKGKEVTSLSFPSVGFELVTRKYMRNFGIYIPKYGVISSNKISHIIYGFSEYPLGDEAIVFTITTGPVSYRYWWGPDGIVFLSEGPPVTAYYVQEFEGELVQISGNKIQGIVCKFLQWFHMRKLHETKDYIVNIGGVNYLLMGIRKIVVNIEDSLARVGNSFRSVDLFDGRYFYDLDNKVVMTSTTRNPESFGTYEHIMKNAMVVREFLLFTKMLDIVVTANMILPNIQIIPCGSSTVDLDRNNNVVFFDRSSTKLGTSRNYNVFQRVNRLRFLLLDDTLNMNVSFVGNNRVCYYRKTYYARITSDHPFASYIGKKKKLFF